ncbi:hypothetical protein PR048_012117 [Dryococelus australis]|uniref:Uncharacterized protein n=1 Tax=Dryococelus australis TaxID=614101 RepID=A0ABQ9HNJ4_9NEOP|nr:hypothetical protein PR048_012117 [Dryococelus australis]
MGEHLKEKYSTLGYQTNVSDCKPPQILADELPVQELKGYHLTFQTKNNLATKIYEAFTLKGFRNWKIAIETFTIHEKISSHSQAVLRF